MFAFRHCALQICLRYALLLLLPVDAIIFLLPRVFRAAITP